MSAPNSVKIELFGEDLNNCFTNKNEEKAIRFAEESEESLSTLAGKFWDIGERLELSSRSFEKVATVSRKSIQALSDVGLAAKKLSSQLRKESE